MVVKSISCLNRRLNLKTMKGSLQMLPGESSHERSIYILLSTFRFFSFALAVALVTTLSQEPVISSRMLGIISFVGVYSILKIILRFHLWQRDLLTYMMLGGDMAVCLAIVVLTGGVDSPFLLYSLVPTITAALFFESRVALIVATLSSLNIILAHQGWSPLSLNYAHILQAEYLLPVLLYSVFCFVIATITYRANLNVYRRILSDAIVGERRRLRQEIHDNIAQTLGYLNMKMGLMSKLPSADEKLLAEVNEVYKVVSESYQDTRDAIDSLSSLSIGEKPVSLVAELPGYVDQLSKRTGIKTTLAMAKELPSLDPVIQLQLLRIVQEALSNIRKHADASRVWVSLESTPQYVELVVKDDGRGFSPLEQRGSGLRIMAERASSVNGVLTVNSSPGKGTEVRAKVPRR